MDELIQAALLALVQGLTEFLPISSSAHLILPGLLLGWQDQGLVFDVAVHLGTLLAVVIYFRHTLFRLTAGSMAAMSQRCWNAEVSLVASLAIATLPIALVGLLVGDWVENELRNLPVIAVATIGFGLLLAAADYYARGDAELSPLKALWIGMAQVLALVPGTSRSGVTITAALMCGLHREAATRFSFLLAIPAIFGASCLQLVRLMQSEHAINWPLLAVAVLVSAVAAFLTIRWFLALVQRIGFMPFVVYRCVLGLFLIFIWIG